MNANGERVSIFDLTRQLGGEVISGCSWDQHGFSTRKAFQTLLRFVIDNGLAYQISTQMPGDYRLRVR